MSDDDIVTTILVALLTTHITALLVTRLKPEWVRVVPGLNVLVGLSMAVAGVNAWVESARSGYSVDELGVFGALYGGAVLALSLARLVKGLSPRGLHTGILVVHTLVLAAATYLFVTFEMTRLW